MFERYTSLQTLYLPNFDTSSLTDMDYIFNGYSSLKYIDISNIKDSKNLLKFAVSELNSKESLTVCQNDTINNNPSAFNKCLKNIDDIFVCNNIQTTIPLIQTTIPILYSTIPQIKTTIPIILSTISQIQTTIPI